MVSSQSLSRMVNVRSVADTTSDMPSVIEVPPVLLVLLTGGSGWQVDFFVEIAHVVAAAHANISSERKEVSAHGTDSAPRRRVDISSRIYSVFSSPLLHSHVCARSPAC